MSFDNVDKIVSFGGNNLGLIGAMEWGAVLRKRDDGTGRIHYQGKTYSATEKQVADCIKLPYVRHIRLGMYVIPKRYRKTMM